LTSSANQTARDFTRKLQATLKHIRALQQRDLKQFGDRRSREVHKKRLRFLERLLTLFELDFLTCDLSQYPEPFLELGRRIGCVSDALLKAHTGVKEFEEFTRG
jgi:hypothetical protein